MELVKSLMKYPGFCKNGNCNIISQSFNKDMTQHLTPTRRNGNILLNAAVINLKILTLSKSTWAAYKAYNVEDL